MKKTFKISIVISLLTLIFIGCSRSGDGGSDGASGQYYIKMAVDGAMKNGIATTSYLSKHTPTIDGVPQNRKQLIVTNGGFGGNVMETITISLNNFTGKGTYSLAADSPDAVAQYAKVGSDPNQVYGRISGNVVITDYATTTIKGTFEFVGKSISGATVNITKGEFYLQVSDQ